MITTEMVIGGLVVVALIAWGVWGQLGRNATPPRGDNDPIDDRDVGFMVGMTGGSISDAAVARYAIRRFEQQYGRRPTWKEVGFVLGMMQGIDPNNPE